MAQNDAGVVETLEVDVKIKGAEDFQKQIDTLNDKVDDYAKALEDADKEIESMSESHKKLNQQLNKVVTGLGRFMSAMAMATGVKKLVDDVAKANDQLGFLEKQLNTSTSTLKAWQGAVSAGGGSAEGLTSSFKTLAQGAQDFVTTGNSSMLPALNALNVSMTDAQGNIRKTDDVLLDLSQSLSSMESGQAYLVGKKLGLDEGTIGTLIQGRDALKESIAYQKTLYQSSEQDIRNSRELQKNRALLNSQWESFKTMLGNQLVPIANRVAVIFLQIFDNMQKHQGTIKAVFGGLAVLLSASIIPLFTRALAPLLAFLGPFAPFIAVVAALGAGFLGLYDDYKTWAEGGKSLFDWGALKQFMDENKFSAENLGKAFLLIGQQIKESFIPTIKEYMEIVQDLLNGDFDKAAEHTGRMFDSFSKKAIDVVAVATDQNATDLTGFIGESAFRLTHRGMDYDEYENSKKPKTVQGTSVTTPSSKKSNSNFMTEFKEDAQKAGITDTNELNALVAIVGHETGDGKAKSEQSGYSYKTWQEMAKKGQQRNVKKWIDTHTQDDFKKLSGKDKLDIMYEGMNGNKAGEGYLFRGRGGMQLTGRANYQAFANSINRQDIMQNPDLVATDNELAKQSTIWFWKNNKKLRKLGQSGEIEKARAIVNGGTIGMEDTIARYKSLSSISNAKNSLQPNIPKNSINNTTNSSRGGDTNVTVTIPNLNVSSSSSTIEGNTSDAIKGITNGVNLLIPSLR